MFRYFHYNSFKLRLFICWSCYNEIYIFGFYRNYFIKLCLLWRIARDAKSAAGDAEDAANDAKLGASLDCIRSGGIMVGNTCM